MKAVAWVVSAIALLALGTVGGVYVTGGLGAVQQLASGDLPAAEAAPKPEATPTPPEPPAAAGEYDH